MFCYCRLVKLAEEGGRCMLREGGCTQSGGPVGGRGLKGRVGVFVRPVNNWEINRGKRRGGNGGDESRSVIREHVHVQIKGVLIEVIIRSHHIVRPVHRGARQDWSSPLVARSKLGGYSRFEEKRG